LDEDKDDIALLVFNEIGEENLNNARIVLKEGIAKHELVNYLQLLASIGLNGYTQRLKEEANNFVLEDIKTNLVHLVENKYKSQLNEETTNAIAYCATEFVTVYFVALFEECYASDMLEKVFELLQSKLLDNNKKTKQ